MTTLTGQLIGLFGDIFTETKGSAIADLVGINLANFSVEKAKNIARIQGDEAAKKYIEAILASKQASHFALGLGKNVMDKIRDFAKAQGVNADLADRSVDYAMDFARHAVNTQYDALKDAATKGPADFARAWNQAIDDAATELRPGNVVDVVYFGNTPLGHVPGCSEFGAQVTSQLGQRILAILDKAKSTQPVNITELDIEAVKPRTERGMSREEAFRLPNYMDAPCCHGRLRAAANTADSGKTGRALLAKDELEAYDKVLAAWQAGCVANNVEAEEMNSILNALGKCNEYGLLLAISVADETSWHQANAAIRAAAASAVDYDAEDWKETFAKAYAAARTDFVTFANAVRAEVGAGFTGVVNFADGRWNALTGTLNQFQQNVLGRFDQAYTWLDGRFDEQIAEARNAMRWYYGLCVAFLPILISYFIPGKGAWWWLPGVIFLLGALPGAVCVVQLSWRTAAADVVLGSLGFLGRHFGALLGRMTPQGADGNQVSEGRYSNPFQNFTWALRGWFIASALFFMVPYAEELGICDHKIGFLVRVVGGFLSLGTLMNSAFLQQVRTLGEDGERRYTNRVLATETFTTGWMAKLGAPYFVGGIVMVLASLGAWGLADGNHEALHVYDDEVRVGNRKVPVEDVVGESEYFVCGHSHVLHLRTGEMIDTSWNGTLFETHPVSYKVRVDHSWDGWSILQARKAGGVLYTAFPGGKHDKPLTLADSATFNATYNVDVDPMFENSSEFWYDYWGFLRVEDPEYRFRNVPGFDVEVRKDNSIAVRTSTESEAALKASEESASGRLKARFVKKLTEETTPWQKAGSLVLLLLGVMILAIAVKSRNVVMITIGSVMALAGLPLLIVHLVRLLL